jgi:hypothetical protein
MLDRSLLQVIENLIADELMLADIPDCLQSLIEVCFLKVANAPGENLAFAKKLIEGGEGIFQRIATAPMQQIAIEPVGPESSERSLACGDGFPARGIFRQNFLNQKHFVAAPGDRFGNQLFHSAAPVHLRGINVVHAEIQTRLQGADRLSAIAHLEVPGPLPNDRNFSLRQTELSIFHDAMLLHRCLFSNTDLMQSLGGLQTHHR